ncbi:glypican-6 isoform X2 [Stomoxys calcitrans]|uniref:glypican-6 isoform X2 n=1 Tax=Stomoxys calcitrans TaxID=35570 RepID=UPI0027E35EB1|nr:glypican-6 isoform X2 [Stomoxys calcitrans]
MSSFDSSPSSCSMGKRKNCAWLSSCFSSTQQKHYCLSFGNIYCRPLVFLAIALVCGLLTHASDAALDLNAAPPPPLAAALASPGGSSILEQFSPNCSAVSHIFTSRGIDPAEIPQKPSNEMGLRYCESPSVGTCCTHSMETKMAMQSRLQLEKHSKEQILKMSRTLSDKAQKFNENFRKLLQESKSEFHSMFTRTYGVIYQQNAYVFSDLFNELENYYNRGRVDLLDVMDTFFNTLYQKMFQVLNVQYSFDEKYLRCVSEHMKELKPFGDVPDKLSVQIKRSFVATRTYGQALNTAADVSKRLVNIRLNADCTSALTKMQHCGSCKGYSEKPCTNYCVNVIKGCLHYFNELDTEWENYAGAMDKVAERLLGSFNIVMVVEPINIKISEAIMNFQDSGHDITNRVFQGCGRPTLGRSKRSINPKFPASEETKQNHHVKRSAAANDIEQLESDILDIDASLDDAIILREKRAADPGNRDSSEGDNNGGGGGNNRRNNNKRKQQNRKNDDNDYGRDPALDKLVKDIRQRVKDYKKFWSNLPHQICSNDEISTSTDADGMCWNGHTIDRYMHSVSTEHSSNPEFPGNPATTKQTSQVATQVYYLKNAISHLRNAYNGQDVDWSDQEPYYGSGAGSGGGVDDEDDDEGSGLGSPFTPSQKPDPTERPNIDGNRVDDEDDDEDIVKQRTDIGMGGGIIGGAGGVGGGIQTQTSRPHSPHNTNTLDEDDADSHHDHHEDDDIDEDLKSSGSSRPEKMSLRRALFMYLVPLYMAWFGGIIVDLL